MPTSTSPADILAQIYKEATHPRTIVIAADILTKLDYICHNEQNRAGIRLLMACLLAKLHRPEIDVRKPYTEIGDPDAFSGRTYDEDYIAPFVIQQELPCNATTAFLTPALRNRNVMLTPDLNLVGRPPELYHAALELLTMVHDGRVTPEVLLTQAVRCLLALRDERRQRLRSLLAQLRPAEDDVSLAAEVIVTLIESHMKLPRTSRLPVLAVTAAYQAAAAQLGEYAQPLQAHNAADKQTGALGDIEIALITDNTIYTCYEMKDKRVVKGDIYNALIKVSDFSQRTGYRIGQYIFITTEDIEQSAVDYAAGLYVETNGIEFVVLNCIGFLRSFLHLFHRHRMQFLNAYQELLLAEPDSAVSDALKEAFLALRRAAEAGAGE